MQYMILTMDAIPLLNGIPIKNGSELHAIHQSSACMQYMAIPSRP